jgi:hypothetical protein
MSTPLSTWILSMKMIINHRCAQDFDRSKDLVCLKKDPHDIFFTTYYYFTLLCH